MFSGRSTHICALKGKVEVAKAHIGVGVGVLLAADSQSTSKSGYRASLWDPSPDFI
jgi:hypothetical protein